MGMSQNRGAFSFGAVSKGAFFWCPKPKFWGCPKYGVPICPKPMFLVANIGAPMFLFFGDVPKHTFLFLGMSPNIGLGILGGHIHTQQAQRCLSLQMHHTKGQLRIGHIGLLVQGQVLHDFSQAGIFPPVLFGDGFPQIGNYNASHIRQWHFILAKPYTQSAKSKLICICLAFL